MAGNFDFKKLRKTITIYTVMQIILGLLFVFAAFKFQQQLAMEGRPQRFMHSVLIALGMQLALFYPLSRGAQWEANREAESGLIGITPEQQKTLRTRRAVTDVLKSAVFLFFGTFIWKMPRETFFLSLVLFSFLLTFLSYSQYFSIAAKRKIKELS
jgi:hypothetical protein